MRRTLGLVGVLLTATTTVLAHDSGTPHQEQSTGPDLFPPTVLLAGALVVGTAVVLDRREELTRRQAGAGVAVGALGVLAGIVLFVL